MEILYMEMYICMCIGDEVLQVMWASEYVELQVHTKATDNDVNNAGCYTLRCGVNEIVQMWGAKEVRRLGRDQSSSKKSQSIAVSGAFLVHPNIRFSASTWQFSGERVWISHMRKVMRPRVHTTTTSSSDGSPSRSGSFRRTCRRIRLTNPAENVALAEWCIRPLKSDGNQIVTSDVPPWISR